MICLHCGNPICVDEEQNPSYGTVYVHSGAGSWCPDGENTAEPSVPDALLIAAESSLAALWREVQGTTTVKEEIHAAIKSVLDFASDVHERLRAIERGRR